MGELKELRELRELRELKELKELKTIPKPLITAAKSIVLNSFNSFNS